MKLSPVKRSKLSRSFIFPVSHIDVRKDNFLEKRQSGNIFSEKLLNCFIRPVTFLCKDQTFFSYIIYTNFKLTAMSEIERLMPVSYRRLLELQQLVEAYGKGDTTVMSQIIGLQVNIW